MPRSIYCAYHVFAKIRNSQAEYAPFHALIREHNHIVFDLTEEDYNLKLQETLTAFSGETGVTTDYIPGFLEQLPFSMREGAGSALFILEAHQQDHAKNLRNYGVCAVFLEQPQSLDILQNSFYWQLEKSNQYGGSNALSWQHIVQRAERMPLNALVLVDNYMLRVADQATDRGIINIVDMLAALMPNKHNSALPFQVLLVTAHKDSLHEGLDKSYLPNIQKKLDTTKDLIVDALTRKVRYKIEVGIILHSNAKSDFHRRAIVSNYHFLRLDHGLDAFDRNKVRSHNDISIEGAFRNLGKPRCHMPWNSMALELQSIKKTLLERAGVLKTGLYENRLLELVSLPQSTQSPYKSLLKFTSSC